MIASVYVKEWNIHFYNEENSLPGAGGLAYELGRPLLDFVCYEPERFDEGFSMIAEAFDDEYAHLGAREPEFIVEMKERASALQKSEVYVSFYYQALMDFIFTFLESPQKAIRRLDEIIPGAESRLQWAMDFTWPTPLPGKAFADKEKILFRAATDAISLLSEDLKLAQEAVIYEVELLIALRGKEKTDMPLEYLYLLDEHHKESAGHYHFLEKPFRVFYGIIAPPEIALLHEIDSIKDLLRFEFIKMIEHDIFIKKCKNCGRFFIPKRRADAEYCERLYGGSQRKCSEVGAMLRYERKVAGNPILEAYSKAYKRFNSRTRVKKMTQTEFLNWSEEARKRRDACLAGDLSFDDFVAWLEQGRIRKSHHGQT